MLDTTQRKITVAAETPLRLGKSLAIEGTGSISPVMAQARA
jgi:hypothetical protein